LQVTTKVTDQHMAEHTASAERRTALTPEDTHRNQRTRTTCRPRRCRSRRPGWAYAALDICAGYP